MSAPVKPLEIVEGWESAMCQADDLSDWGSSDERDEYYSGGIFEGDPDILYYDGEPLAYLIFDDGNGELLHLDADFMGEVDDYDQTLADGLALAAQWGAPDGQAKFATVEDQSWDGVKRPGYTLAYRGGSGYTYTLWKLS